jgi:CheY-like chemotaxis protein
LSDPENPHRLVWFRQAYNAILQWIGGRRMQHPRDLWKRLAALMPHLRRESPARDDAGSETKRCALLISADAEVYSTIQQALPEWEIFPAESMPGAATILERQEIGIILLDRDIPDIDWREAVFELSNLPNRLCVIVLVRTAGWNVWDEVIEAGAYDFVRAPYTREALLRIVVAGWSYWRSQRRLRVRPEIPVLASKLRR